MEKQKLSLNSIKVQSFVTALDASEAKTVQGGQQTFNPVCLSEVPACQTAACSIVNICITPPVSSPGNACDI